MKRDAGRVEARKPNAIHETKPTAKTMLAAPIALRRERLAGPGKIQPGISRSRLWRKLTIAEYTVASARKTRLRYGNTFEAKLIPGTPSIIFVLH
jgi:hypothetical protein